MQGRQEAVTGELPIQVHHFWSLRGGRLECVPGELMKTPRKHRADMCRERPSLVKGLTASPLATGLGLCLVRSGSNHKAGWDPLQA